MKGLSFPTGGPIVILLVVPSATDEARDRSEEILYGTAQSRVIERVRERVVHGSISGIEVINRGSGGMPGDGRTEEALAVSET